MEVPLSPRLVRVNGPLLEIEGLADVAMSELVALGVQGIPGEVVAIRGTTVTVQAYEYTGGMAAGDPVAALGHPLSARLGHTCSEGSSTVCSGRCPGPDLAGPAGDRRDQPSTWTWQPRVAQGETVSEGACSAPSRSRTAWSSACWCRQAPADAWSGWPPRHPRHTGRGCRGLGRSRLLTTDWPVRRARPVRERLKSDEPLLTGQRVLDAVFPSRGGSTAAVPGGFGTGKTMLLQQIAKWCAAEVIVYVGCGERGNEMADVLAELSELADPRTGRRLAERTVIIANTSNMPMMAGRPASTPGVTVAEYFRDMGYDAVVIADSTSRWAEALREFASRSGALPAEEGYPASLPRRSRRSMSAPGESPPSAADPPRSPSSAPSLRGRQHRTVTAHTHASSAACGVSTASWPTPALPGCGLGRSFSRDAEGLGQWYRGRRDPTGAATGRVTSVLAEADRLGDLAALVGTGSLPGHERWFSSRAADARGVFCSRMLCLPTTPTARARRPPRSSTRC